MTFVETISKRTIWIVSVAFVVWAALLLAAYYAVQKPIRPDEIEDIIAGLSAFRGAPSLAGIIESVLNLGVAGLIVVVATLFGSRLSPLRRPVGDASTTDRIEYWLAAAGIGLMAVSLLTFGLALIGSLHPWLVFAVVLGMPLLVSLTSLPRLASDLRRCARVRLPLALTLATGAMLGLALLTALAPPIAYDAWLYHLAVPAQALAAGRLQLFRRALPQEQFPMLMSSLFLLAMDLQSDVAAQLIHNAFGGLTVGMILLASRQFYRPSSPRYALALGLSMPMLVRLAGWAYSDLALAFYAIAALYAYARWRQNCGRPWLVLAGLLAGATMGLKYTSFVVPAGIVLHAIWQDHRRVVRPIALFVAITLVVAAPWYLKNWWFTGNPVYPFLFGGVEWDAARSIWYAQPGTGIGVDPMALLSLPFTATVGYGDASADGLPGPLILMVAPLLILRMRMAKRSSSVARGLADPFMFVAMLWIAFWLVGVIGSSALRQTRLLLPAIVMLIPVFADAIAASEALDLPQISVRRLLNVIIAMVLALAIVRQAVDFAILNPLAFDLGMESGQAYEERRWLGHVEAMTAINHLPGDARVIFFWEPRSYLARRDVRADPLLDALPHAVTVAGSMDGAVRQWKAEGFTHALIFDAGARFAIEQHINAYTMDDVANLQRLRTVYAREVYRQDGYTLLEFK